MLIHSLPLGKASHSAVALNWLINGQAHSEPSQPVLLLLLLCHNETAAG